MRSYVRACAICTLARGHAQYPIDQWVASIQGNASPRVLWIAPQAEINQSQTKFTFPLTIDKAVLGAISFCQLQISQINQRSDKMSSFKTPPRHRRAAATPHRTPSYASPSLVGCRAYSSTTPGRSAKKNTPGDRFIPNRAAGDMEFARYKVAGRDTIVKGENTNSHGSPSQKEASAAMREKLLSLKGKSSEDRILCFKQTNSISSSNPRTPGKCMW